MSANLLMTSFLATCALGLVFFLIFLAKCWQASKPKHRSARTTLRKIGTFPPCDVDDELFLCMEEEMAEFLSVAERKPSL